MSFAPFLSATDVEGIVRDAALPGFETILAVNGETWLVLARWNDVQQDYVSVPAQRVLVEYADRQERTIRTDAGETVTIDGWFTAIEPFDVERNDLFSLGATGDEERGQIAAVRPARLGTQRAAFRLRLGEQ